jgi:hypothetical protein
VISRHQGPAFQASSSDVVANAVWQAITSWSYRHQDQLQNSMHHLNPQRKKNRLKVPGVKKDIPEMEMIHYHDMALELSARLLATQ